MRDIVGSPESKGKHARVEKSSIDGFGLYACEDFARSVLVCRYDGRRIPAAALACSEAEPGRYWLQLPDGDVLDGACGREPGRWINHSCCPNAEWTERRGEVWARTTRCVRAGEEITVDYGFDLDGATGRPCRCGAANCVGFVVAQAYHPVMRLLYG